ncbi:MAG: hypothetical protein NZL98_00930 [Anaerolineales bacterium]|nr:hypothetical protein [Anaerolineales bacterium]
MKLTLALAQISTRLGDVRANLEKHLVLANEARQSGADLILFPELSLTGYVLQDLAATVAVSSKFDTQLFDPLREVSRYLDLVVGFVEEDRRRRFYIASAYLSKGEVVFVHRKVYLPTYGLFDEGRFFASGNSIRAFETRFGRVGMLICEDFWHISPPYLLWLDGAELFLFSSASPGRGISTDSRLASSTWVTEVNRAYARLFTTFVAHANRVGFEDGLNFWGGSTVFDPDGGLLIQAPDFDENLALCELDLNQIRRTRARLPLLRDEKPELLLQELGRILHER